MARPAPGVQPPESKPNIYSASGTCTHSMGEHCLRTKTEPDQFLDQTLEADGFKFLVEQDRVDRCKQYVDKVRSLVGRLLVEAKLTTSLWHGVPGQSGTGDNVVLNRGQREIVVGDLKDGNGIVFAWTDPGEGQPRWMGGNAQLMSYGNAALEQYDFYGDWETVRLVIHQYSIGHYDEVVFTVEEMRAWAAWAKPREQLAHRLWLEGTDEEILANLNPSPKACEWCPVKSTCAKRAESIMSMFPVAPKLDTLHVTNAQLAEINEKADDVISFFQDARAESLRRALAGNKIPGWKSVPGRQGNRKLTDAEAAAKALKEGVEYTVTVQDDNDRPVQVRRYAEPLPLELLAKCYTKPELESPTALEKVLKSKAKSMWAALQQFVTRADGAHSLVRDYDQRPESTPMAADFALAPVQDEFSTKGTPPNWSEGLV